ncbi:tRNA 2-thiouridine synthesizing protein A [Oceanospirillum multiglobuliferum]|uniref:Sulfurtransferase TusA n=1 Tax=Oceanospirillum multiglobuliferum TaxID=64969 RepID=A0A1T4RPE4_9GAMM|nr:sulfurtransferase TusA [Oceanospirillum multiglobuliferum]OPX54662.1 sulfurtransferase TusA [Oceanospirillum multiglobuliferum]SKA17812.1 tRNA 2-thiouridine synthesizing protein A [Oceanospirillum multiglobuliferum]
MPEIQFTHELDTSGLLCPEPVMMLHGKVKELTTGDILRVVATDPSTTRDIPKFCQFLSFPLLAQEQQDDIFIYYIEKK